MFSYSGKPNVYYRLVNSRPTTIGNAAITAATPQWRFLRTENNMRRHKKQRITLTWNMAFMMETFRIAVTKWVTSEHQALRMWSFLDMRVEDASEGKRNAIFIGTVMLVPETPELKDFNFFPKAESVKHVKVAGVCQLTALSGGKLEADVSVWYMLDTKDKEVGLIETGDAYYIYSDGAHEHSAHLDEIPNKYRVLSAWLAQPDGVTCSTLDD